MPLPALLIWMVSALAHARSAVVVMTSDDLPEYEAPIAAFSRSVARPVQVLHIDGDRKQAERLAANLQSDSPPVIFALGAKAAWTAVHQVPGVPVVYGMVMDPDRYGIRGAFVTGVSMEVPPDLVLAQFRLFAPDVRRLGVVVGTDNDRRSVKEAIEAARTTGYEVLVRRVGGPKDVRRAFNRLLVEVDAVWLLPDPDVVTPGNFHYIRNAAIRARLPVLAYSDTLVEAGALMCVAADPEQAGLQAADLVAEILAGTTAGVIDPLAPDEPRVVLNRDTQQAIGLRLDEVLLEFVDEVVRPATQR